MGNEQSFEKGDLLYRELQGPAGKATYLTTFQLGYHYGVYIGDDTVIDFSQEFGFRRCSLETFAAGLDVFKESVWTRRTKDEILSEAVYYYLCQDEWGEYSLMTNNCEHFARYCTTGRKISLQVIKLVAAGVAGVVATVGLGLILIDDSREDDEEHSEPFEL